MEIEWTTPWFLIVEKEQTWESIAKNVKFFRETVPEHDVGFWVQSLKQSNPEIASKELREGMQLYVPFNP